MRIKITVGIFLTIIFLNQPLIMAARMYSEQEIQSLQDQAKEYIVIKVISVTRVPLKSKRFQDQIIADAIVKSVIRSESILKAGEQIRIKYMYFDGEGNITPLLRTGDICRAYLKYQQENDCYIPDANPFSFFFIERRETWEKTK